MAYCSNCGRRIYADDNFCSGCGQPVSRVATPSPISSSANPAVTEGRRQPRPVSTGTQADNYSFSSGSTPGPAKGGSSAGKLISIIVFLIFLTTFVVFILGVLGMTRAFW